MSSDLYSGPIDYLVFAFSAGASAEAGLVALLDAVDAGSIEVLDLERIGRDADGHGVRLPLDGLHVDGPLDPTILAGVESRILDAEDLDTIAAELEPDGFALALVYLEHSLDPAARAWLAVGGRPLLSGGIDPDDLQDALDQTSDPTSNQE